MIFRTLFVLVLAGLLTGCSTFHRDWKTATTQPVTGKTVEGPWEGTWLSDKNQHTGKLRCLVTKREGDRHEFRFWATYWKIFRATYTTEFTVKTDGDTHRFKGDEYLGKLAGGLYSYEGQIKAGKFDATYRSAYDHGTFQMERPAPAP